MNFQCKLLIYAFAIGIAVGKTAAGEEPAKHATDNERLLGTWSQVAYEEDGKPQHSGMHYFRFSGKKAEEWFAPGNAVSVRRWEYEIDPSANPKHLDILDPNSGPHPGFVSGIYSFEGDKLVWVWDSSNKPGYTDPNTKIEYTHRPTSFTTAAGSGLQRYTYARVTDPKLAAPPSDDARAPK
jgi:uncharacterized protein (TIGR03067 family)